MNKQLKQHQPMRIDANFPGGAVCNVDFCTDDMIRFEAPLEGSTQSMWFYFRIRGGKGKKLHFIQKELQHVLAVMEGATYAEVQPVVKHGEQGKWMRIPKEQTTFINVPLDYRFTITPQEDTMYIAFSYPYTQVHLEHCLDAMHSSYIEKKIIGKTAEGRDFPMLLIQDDGFKNDKRLIVCLARQHAGEVSGSFVLEGLLRQAAADSQWGRSFRENFVLTVFPFADLDGVEEGRYGKNRGPVDFNRDWCNNSQHVEVRLMKSQIEQLSDKFDYTVFLDLHAPQPGGNCFLLPARLSAMDEHRREVAWNVLRCLGQRMDPIFSCSLEDRPDNSFNWSKENYQYVAGGYQARKFGVTSFTVETSYHTDSKGKLLAPDDWRQLGDQLLQTLAEKYEDGGKASGQSAVEKHEKNSTVSGPPAAGISQETIWEHWEMVTLPQHTTVSPRSDVDGDGDGVVQFVSTDRRGEAWLTFKPFFSGSGDTQPTLIWECDLIDDGGQAEIYIYGYKNGEVKSKFVKETIRLFTGNWKMILELAQEPIQEPMQDSKIDYRISIRIMNFHGNVTVRIM